MGTIKPNTYPVATGITITLDGLASTTADPPVGRQSNIVAQESDLAQDVMISGQIKAGTTPTAGKIQIFAFGASKITSGPTYRIPASFGASDAGRTPGAFWKDVIFPVLSITTDTTTGKVYDFAGISILKAFGGLFLPNEWGLFVFHSMVAALDNAGGNNVLEYTPMQSQY